MVFSPPGLRGPAEFGKREEEGEEEGGGSSRGNGAGLEGGERRREELSCLAGEVVVGARGVEVEVSPAEVRGGGGGASPEEEVELGARLRELGRGN